MKRTKSSAGVTAGSGNVFADLGLPDAEALSIQAELTRLIYLQIKNVVSARSGRRHFWA